MAKTNFSKVEESLTSGLMKISVGQLYKLSDVAQKFGRPELRDMTEKAFAMASKAVLEKKTILYVVRTGLKKNTEIKFYEQLGITQQELQHLVDKKFPKITEEEWAKLTKARDSFSAAKKQSLEEDKAPKDDSIVENERKKHIYKRFNVNEKWLPLK